MTTTPQSYYTDPPRPPRDPVTGAPLPDTQQPTTVIRPGPLFYIAVVAVVAFLWWQDHRGHG